MNIENETFSRMLDDVEDYAILLLDKTGNIITWNKGAEKIKGYTREEILGSNFEIFYTQEDQENHLPAMHIKEAAENGKATYEGWRVRKNGTRFWGNIVITAIHNENGVIDRFSKVTRDLTEKKLAEEKLLQFNEELERKLKAQTEEIYKSEKRFRALVENITDAISMHDEEGDLLYQSPSVSRITGYTQDEAKGKALTDFFHADDMPAILQQLEKVRNNPGVPIQSIKKVRHKDGHYIWTEGTTTNLLHDDNVRAIVGNFRDVTERKLAEEEIEKSEKRFRALLENSYDAISLLDEQGKVIYSSPGTKRMLGYTHEESMGIPGVDFFHPDDVPAIRQRLADALEQPGKPIFRTNRLRHKDGHYIWVEGTTTNLLQDENVKAFVGNFHDITERKIAEEKNEKIEKRIAAERERFAELFLQAPSCICILAGEDHVYEMANPLYLEITGKHDVIGKTAAEVFPELVEQGFMALLNNVYTSGTPISGKEAFIQIDALGTGELVDHYMDFVYQPYRDHNGVIEGVFFFANLVTEQVVARKKIEQHEKHFRALVENATDLVIKTDETGILTYTSPAHKKLTGCSPQDLLGRSFYSFQHPDHRPELKQKFAELLANPGIPMHRISRFRRSDGTYIWVEGTVMNLLDDENVKGIVCNFHDITESKLAALKLIHANRLYAFISQINQTIVHITDKQTLFKKACHIAVDIGKYQMAWIGEVDTLQKRITLKESAGIPDKDLPLFNNVPYDENGPQDRAIKTEAYYVCNDIGHDLETVSWKPFASHYSLHSCMVLPILMSGTVIATFNLYSSELNLFDQQEINLLKEVAGDISFALDIFEKERHKKEIEDKIVRSELRLKQAQAIAQLGSWELDMETGVAIWSEEFCKIYGLATDDNIQTYQSWIAQIHPEDLAYTKQVTDEGRRTLTNFNFHHRIIRKDGAIRAIYSQAEFIFNSERVATGMHGVSHDITEMKDSEKAFAQSEANLRQLMDLIPQSIFAKDYSGAYVFVNKNFAGLYGLAAEEMINRSVTETIPVVGEAAEFLKEDREVILSGVSKIIPEHPFTDRFGEKHIFHTVKVPYTIAGTNKKAALGITIDITEQKKAEAERTKIIADMVRRNNDLEQFSYIVSHNLRAPVANILGLVNIMQTMGVNEEEEKIIIEGLASATENLDMVIRDINNILDLRYSANEKRENVNFEQLLKDVKLTIVNTTRDDNIEIISNFSQVAEIFTVKSYLYSIFSNLISNSIKYKCPDKPVLIEITTERTEKGMLIKFKDNGLGINLKKEGGFVFGLYKRFHFHKEGKGLGLFMVKTQVEALGGNITISSTINEGTEFNIEFPR